MTDSAASPPGISPKISRATRYAVELARLRTDAYTILSGDRLAEVGENVGRVILDALRATGAGPTRSELAAYLDVDALFPPPQDMPEKDRRWWRQNAVNRVISVLQGHNIVTCTRKPRSLRTGPAYYTAVKAHTESPASRTPADTPAGDPGGG